MNEQFSDAMNLWNIDFVYHFQQLACMTERLLVVSSVKNLVKPCVIPVRMCVLHPRTSLLLIEDTMVWEVREWFNIKDNQHIEGPLEKAFYELYVPGIQNNDGIFEFFLVRQFVYVEIMASQGKVTIMEGSGFHVPRFRTECHLFFDTLARENACRMWFFWEGISQGKLTCGTVAREKDGLSLLLNGW